MKASNLSSTSRYAVIETAQLPGSDGTMIVYLRRRMVPDPNAFSLLTEHTVRQGERLDNITAHYFQDPELFWRICDANGAMRPSELTDVTGRRIRITLPEGYQAPPMSHA